MSEYHKPRKMDKDEHQLERPYADLCVAVVIQACRDYRHALMMKKAGKTKHSRDERNAYYQYMNIDDEIKACEQWFKEDISLWCDLDGEWIIKKIQDSVNKKQG